MNTPDQDPPGWVICPRTGRKWPAIKRFELKTCVLCGGFIDTRTEPWRGDDRGANPQHGTTCPPQRVVAGEALQKGDAIALAPVKPLTGKEMLAAMEVYRDKVHEDWLNDPTNRTDTEDGG